MTKQVLIVDDHEMFRESIGEALAIRGYSVLEADSIPSALVQVAKNRLDIALVDICMPDYDGIQFLRIMKERSDGQKFPIILMTAQPRREYIDEAAKFGVCDFVVKAAFSINELISRIELRMSPDSPTSPPPPPASLRKFDPLPEVREDPPRSAQVTSIRVPSNWSAPPSTGAAPSSFSSRPSTAPTSHFEHQREVEERRRRVAIRSRQLRSIEPRHLPGPVAGVLELASSITVSLPQLEAVVRRDPILSARILGLANSALFRGTGNVGQLDESLRTAGIDAVVEMISALPKAHSEPLPSPLRQDLSSLGWHSLATAIAADRIAPSAGRSGAYLAGLFHDLPLLVALQALGDEWDECLTDQTKHGDSPTEALCRSFGMVVGQVALEVYNRYRLPETIAGPLRDYHNICLGRQPREAGDLPRRVDFAHNLAAAMGFDWNDLADVRPISRKDLQTARESERLILDFPQLSEEILAEGARAGLEEWNQVHVRRQSSWGRTPILYWRDPRWAAPDPLEHVLLRSELLERVDSIDTFVEAKGVRKVAAAEPDSKEWTSALGANGPVLVLHSASVGATVAPRQTRLVRLPIAVWSLRETLVEMDSL